MKLTRKQKASIKAILALESYLLALILDLRKTHGTSFVPKNVVEPLRDYQRFLVLRVLYPDQRFCPINADTLWHAHILDTRTYHADCLRVFGEFLHHDPNPVDAHLLATATWEMRLKTFSSGAWGAPDPLLRPLQLTKDETSLAKVHSVDCYTGHCGGA